MKYMLSIASLILAGLLTTSSHAMENPAGSLFETESLEKDLGIKPSKNDELPVEQKEAAQANQYPEQKLEKINQNNRD